MRPHVSLTRVVWQEYSIQVLSGAAGCSAELCGGCVVSADASLLTMCDMSLGRVLDAFDTHSLWEAARERQHVQRF